MTRSARGSRPGRARRRDRGVTTLETLVMFPILFLLLSIIFDESIYYYGKQAALAAAQNGVRVEQVAPGQGAAAARTFLSGTAGNLLTGVTVTETTVPVGAPGAGNLIQITVTGSPLNMAVGFSFLSNVTQTAVGPVEAFSWGP